MEDFIILISITYVLILFVIIFNRNRKKKKASKTIVLTAENTEELQIGDIIIINGKKEVVESINDKTCITILNK